MSPTGQILLWQLQSQPRAVDGDQDLTGCSSLPSVWSRVPSHASFPPIPKPAFAHASVALRVGWRCTRLSLQLLYPNASQRNAVERRASSSKHEDEWQWHSNHSTTLAAPYMFSLLSQLPFPICEAEHCLLSHMYLKRKKRKEKKRERQGN